MMKKLNPKVKLSGRSVRSLTAAGIIVKEPFTVPLTCVDLDGIRLKHSFLLSECAPLNLLGRDLMCKLGLCIESTPDGVIVSKSIPESLCMVKYNLDTPLYIYQYELIPTAVGAVNQQLVDMASDRADPGAQLRDPQHLHCIAHISTGQDIEYEEKWFGKEEKQKQLERLGVNEMYWSGSKCAATVEFITAQTLKSNPNSMNAETSVSRFERPSPFDVPYSFPHVSLAKGQKDQWRDLGPWVKTCSEATEWTPTGREDTHQNYVNGEKVFKQTLCSHVTVQRTISIAENKGSNSHEAIQMMTSSEIIPELDTLPTALWAQGKYDVGLIKNMQPVEVVPKSTFRPCTHQYPIKREAAEGIKPVFESLLQAGVIVECNNSPVRTPIFPVKKIRAPGEPVEWRFVQDLKAVNAAVHPRAPVVPNPYTILSQIPGDTKYFSVVDLSNAFFSVPVHPDSQFWFAFTFEGKTYTWTRLPQGYCESPTIYNAALQTDLEDLELPQGSVVLQYVDDLLLCSPSEQACKADTVTLLRHLYDKGHKASRKKLQWCKKEVTFLGHALTPGEKKLTSTRVTAIQNIPKPVTVKHMLSFLGMTSYCRQFIQDYSTLESPLSAIAHGPGLTSNSRIKWTPEAETAFVEMKSTMASAPTLGIPNPTKPFTQMVDIKGDFMTSVLTQDHGGRLRPTAYFSSRLDPVAAGLPLCLKAVAAAEKAVMASRDFVGYAPLTLLVPHAVAALLIEQKTSRLSAARWLRYNNTLLNMPNITVKRCNVLNPATLLPIPGDGEPHDCCAIVSIVCSPRIDLRDQPIPNAEEELFVDGSASRGGDMGGNCVGYAVVTLHQTIESGRLPANYSAQAAELVALTQACKYAKGKRVTIYTDSRYAFGVVHDFGTLWKQRGFLTSAGKHITHFELVADLLDAILLPAQIAVVKCDAHTGHTDDVSKGNALADAAAKFAAGKHSPATTAAALQKDAEYDSELSLQEIQAHAPQKETLAWKHKGCKKEDGVWRAPDGKPCLPAWFFPYYAKLTHGKDHVSKGGMVSTLQQHWFTKGFTNYTKKFCSRCMVCAQCNIGRGIQTEQAAHPEPNGPFDHLMMDFIELTPAEGKKYVLVIVDMFSKWVEAFPTSKADAFAVAKALIKEIIPRWGIPRKITSDNGTHFANTTMSQLGKYYGIDFKRHCVYHPQSAGAVERENGTLKNKLTKCCLDTGLSWPQALPVVLMYMRSRVRAKNGLSPYEVLFGRPPNTGIGPLTGDVKTLGQSDDGMLAYCSSLSKTLQQVHEQVKEALPHPTKGFLHTLKPGDWVVVKEHKRKSWKSPRWSKPVQILLVTHSAVKVPGKGPWVHAQHCRRVPALIEEPSTGPLEESPTTTPLSPEQDNQDE